MHVFSDVRIGEVAVGEPCLGVDGEEETGLCNVGVVARIGVPVLEGSWLAIGVISVPISLIETDRTAGAGDTYGTTAHGNNKKLFHISVNATDTHMHK